MTIDMGEPKPRPEPSKHPIPDYKLDQNFSVGNEAHLNLDDFSALYGESVEAKRVISKNIRNIIQQNVEREEKGLDPLHWVCVSGYLHNMDKIAAAMGDGTKRQYRNWGAQQFAQRLDSSFTEGEHGKFYGKKIFPIRRERKDGDTSDEFEFWVMGVTPGEVDSVLVNFGTPVQEEIAGQRLEASVGISTSTGPEISGILADVIERGEPDDVMLSRLRRENLLNRLGRELVDNGKNFSPHEREVLRRAKALLERDDERKLTVSTAKLEAEKDIQLEEKDDEIAKLQGRGEPERRPNSRFHTEISEYMKQGHPEPSARAMVARDVSKTRQEVKLIEQALTDPLTGLYNRRWLERELPRLIEIAQRGALPLTLIVMDIDNFKSINDTLGHAGGDEALQKLSRILRQRSDFAVRLGGDEIALILTNTPYETVRKHGKIKGGALSIVERIYGDLEKENFNISMGLIQQTSEQATELLELADKALERAKKAGKNQAFRYLKLAGGRTQFSKVEVSPSG